jgi:ankyrin repeat protein
MLLENEANTEALSNDGRTPLHYACSCGHKEIARILLDKGAKMEATADVCASVARPS